MYTQTHKAKRKHTKRICEIYRSYLVTYLRLNYFVVTHKLYEKSLGCCHNYLVFALHF